MDVNSGGEPFHRSGPPPQWAAAQWYHISGSPRSPDDPDSDYMFHLPGVFCGSIFGLSDPGVGATSLKVWGYFDTGYGISSAKVALQIGASGGWTGYETIVQGTASSAPAWHSVTFTGPWTAEQLGNFATSLYIMGFGATTTIKCQSLHIKVINE